MKEKLGEILLKSKMGCEKSTLILLEKYKPLIIKAAFTYYIKGYENNDLIQMANLWFLKAINKYDIEKNSNFSAYAMRAIHNNFKSLLRKIAKENYEKIDEELELMDVLKDNYCIEDNYEEKELHYNLLKALKSLGEDDRTFILAIYSNKRGVLMQWSKDNNVSYHKALVKRKAILFKLKMELIQ